MKTELPAFKVTLENGDHFTTSMSPGTTIEQAQAYYLDNYYVDENFETGEEKKLKYTNVEQVHSYRVKFTGRLKGAQGIFYPITDVLYAVNDSDDLKVRALYAKYEHITGLTVEQLD